MDHNAKLDVNEVINLMKLVDEKISGSV